MFWPSLGVGYMKIHLDAPDFTSFILFGIEIAPKEKLCHV